MQKKIIAIVLAVAMMLSLVPMAAFAASENLISRVVTVGKDADLETDATTPVLSLKNNKDNWGASETFRLKLPSTADWNDGMEAAIVAATNDVDITVDDIDVKYITDQVIEVTLTADAVVADVVIKVPMNVTFDDAEGEVKVTVDQMDSALTGGTYTFAIAAAGATVITVDDPETVRRGVAQVGADIVIDETVVGSFGEGEQEFRVRLPKGFEWDTAATTIVPSNLLEAVGDALDEADIVKAGDGTRDMIVSFTIGHASSIRGSLVITPVFDVTKDAAVGEVTVDITNREGDLTSKYGIEIAEYKTFNVDIDIDDVEEFYPGRLDDEFLTDEVTISEDIANSLAKGRTIDFELPDWVALYDDMIVYVNGEEWETIEWDDDEYEVHEFEVTVPDGDDLVALGLAADDDIEITFELPLVAEGTQKGDVVLKIDGAGIDDEELVVAKAVAPVTMEVESVKTVEIGTRKQAVADVTVKEAYAGALRDGEDLVLTVGDVVGYVSVNDFDYEVIDGDIELDDAAGDYDENVMAVNIDADSSKPSTIKFSNVLLDLDRTVPMGTLRISVAGDALIDVMNEDWAERIDRQDYVTVGTPINDGTVKVPEVKFTIGQKTYYVAGAAMEADVAPFIQDARTMVAVRYIAYGLGVSPANVLYDGKDTVTILGDRIVQLKLGSNDLYVNGAVLKMDTAAVIKEGRTFVPIAWIARAMGVNYTWSDATSTVTFN